MKASGMQSLPLPLLLPHSFPWAQSPKSTLCTLLALQRVGGDSQRPTPTSWETHMCKQHVHPGTVTIGYSQGEGGTDPDPVHHTRGGGWRRHALHTHSHVHTCLHTRTHIFARTQAWRPVSQSGPGLGTEQQHWTPCTPPHPRPHFTLSSFASISTTSVSTSSIVALQQERRCLQTNPQQAAEPCRARGQAAVSLSSMPPREDVQWERITELMATCSCQPSCCPGCLRYAGNGGWQRQMPPWAEGDGLGPRST